MASGCQAEEISVICREPAAISLRSTTRVPTQAASCAGTRATPCDLIAVGHGSCGPSAWRIPGEGGRPATNRAISLALRPSQLDELRADTLSKARSDEAIADDVAREMPLQRAQWCVHILSRYTRSVTRAVSAAADVLQP